MTSAANVADSSSPSDQDTQKPIFRKFCGKSGWPSSALLVPGNSVNFTLETASDYVKEDQGKAASEFGFRCVVTGYDEIALTASSSSRKPSKQPRTPATGLLTLEREVAYLAANCASSLLKPDLVLPSPISDLPSPLSEMDEEEEEEVDLTPLDESAKQTFATHQPLLSKGFALAHPPTISQALEGSVPFAGLSTERMFLQDFVGCSPVTSGGRLAQWLQPESYVDTRRCELVLDDSREELKCGWPSTITLITKDQRGDVVVAPDLKVDLQAVPVERKESCSSAGTSIGGGVSQRSTPMTPLDFLYANESSPARTYDFSSNFMSPPTVVDVTMDALPTTTPASDLTYGGHPSPNLDLSYQVTVKDKMSYTAICIMKHYENYSFEELRFATPPVKRPSEKMLVSGNNDGTFAAGWTPGSVGLYDIHVRIDGYPIGEVHRVQVKEAPKAYGLSVVGTSKNYANSFINGGRSLTRTVLHHSSKRLLAFRADYSSGLRLRVAPSLQAEQVGLIQTEDVISFVEEVHNDDGVWLRLAAESTRNYCPRREMKGPLNNGVDGAPEENWKGGRRAKGSSHRKGACRKCHAGTEDSAQLPQEAWVLQHNQHTGKSFLIPVEDENEEASRTEDQEDVEPLSHRSEDGAAAAAAAAAAKSGIDTMQPMELNPYASPQTMQPPRRPPFAPAVIYSNISGNGSETMQVMSAPPPPPPPPIPASPPAEERVPALYYVVKCGASGHNIRSRPSLKASPIGMLILGNTVRVLEEVTNCEGEWIRLDAESASRYCHTTDADAWSLAKNATSKTTYLIHESEVAPSSRGAGVFNGAGSAAAAGAASFGGSPFQQPRQSALWEAQSRSGGLMPGRVDGIRTRPFNGRFPSESGDPERNAFQPAVGIPFADEAGQRSSITDDHSR